MARANAAGKKSKRRKRPAAAPPAPGAGDVPQQEHEAPVREEQAPVEDGDPQPDFCVEMVQLRAELREGQAEMAARFGVSQKTVARWEDGVRPSPLQARGVVSALGEFAPAYVPRVAAALGLPLFTPTAAPAPLEGPPAPGAASEAIVKAALDGAIFEASERLGTPSARVREVILLVLERMALLHLDVGSAAALVRRSG